MKIGLIGHNGFIGKQVFNRLTLEGHDVTVYERRIEELGVTSKYPKFWEFINCQLIINLAGKNKGTDKEIIETNLIGTSYLIDWCLAMNKTVMLAGSDYKTDGAYKQSKDAVKALCRAYEHLGLTSCVLNLPKVIGPGCKPYYNSFVTTLIYLASKNQLNKNINLIKDMDEVVELIEVQDVCDAIIDLIKHPSSGFSEYIFTRYDRVFRPTFRQIVDALNGKHELSFITGLLQWYKENEI